MFGIGKSAGPPKEKPANAPKTRPSKAEAKTSKKVIRPAKSKGPSLRERINNLSFKPKAGGPKQYSGERIIVLVGDEGTVLVHIKKGKVISRAYSALVDAPETETLSQIAIKAARVPVYVYFDTVDQTYIPQTLPPVTSLSVKKLITRRLDRDFSNEYIKGALNQGREKNGRKDWLFMMAALKRTIAVTGWIDLIAQWPNRCKGVFLLPVESLELVKRLQLSLYPAALKQKTPHWQILVTYNKVSGIRQVIYHHNKLVLTRLGQPAVDATAETIAGTIEQEIAGTKEYIKRLGFEEQEGLSLTVIVWQQIANCLDISKIKTDQTDVLTPHRAAELLALDGAAQPTDRFADSFLCAALATNRKSQLTLSIPELKKQQMLANAMQVQRVLAAACGAFLLWGIGSTVWNVYTVGDQLTELRQTHAARLQEFELVKKKTTRTPEELDRIASMVELYEVIVKDAYGPEPTFSLIGQALAGEVFAESIVWDVRELKPGEQVIIVPGQPPKTGTQVESTITLQFEGDLVADRVKLQQKTTDILNRMKGKFPKYEVKYTLTPSILSDSDQIDMNLNQASSAPKPEEKKPPQIQQAKIALSGPIDMGETNGTGQPNTP